MACVPLVFLSTRVLPGSTLFPYTTLFRSVVVVRDPSAVPHGQVVVGVGDPDDCAEALTFGFEEAEPRQASLLAVHAWPDRKSTRLNSSHMSTSYAVFCLKKNRAGVPLVVA